MEGQLPRAAPLPRPRVGSRASATAGLVDVGPASARSSSDGMPPSSIPTSVSMPNCYSSSTDLIDLEPDDLMDSRLSRSASSASRANRLSLTLPIALPNANPSRPMPPSATVSSFPATPSDIPSGLASPAEPPDFITAIAAQERRVLEIREELKRAEGQLSKLKKQWQHHEVHRKRAEIRRTEALRPMSGRLSITSPPSETVPMWASAVNSPTADSVESTETKRSAELERRKALLLLQQAGSGPSTPTTSKRRVFVSGRHTRTLSLLSPAKSTDGFPLSGHEGRREARDAGKLPTPPHEFDSPFYQNLGRYAPLTAAQLSKRASWTPQSVHQAGLKQVAGDLTATLWTFVEDLRQATVGDEPITGGTSSVMRSLDANTRSVYTDEPPHQQSTIRASNTSGRPSASRAFDAESQTSSAPSSQYSSASDQKKDSVSSVGSSGSARLSRSESKKGKRFSWTPLTMDSYDDSDWSCWDSPTNTVKSPRWSGSTMGGDMATTTATIPEQADENSLLESTSCTSPSSPSPPTPTRGSDLGWPTALSLNRLTPGSIKRTATDFMKEWEKSLALAVEAGVADEMGHVGHM